jgi:transcriptional regulator with GAF, ATPase, and Fis domain
MRTFATLADTLVVGYDVVDLLQTLVDSCRDLLDAAAAGILLADDSGYLEVVASTSESTHLVDVLQLASEAGPGKESFETGQSVFTLDIADAPPSWRRFSESALSQGFHSVVTFPLRLREVTIGTLTLFRSSTDDMDELDSTAARAFADVATIGILHERSLRESTVLAQQLQHALSSRIVIEQAKGVLAHRHSITVDDAFTMLRSYARSTQTGISAVASRILDKSLSL